MGALKHLRAISSKHFKTSASARKNFFPHPYPFALVVKWTVCEQATN